MLNWKVLTALTLSTALSLVSSAGAQPTSVKRVEPFARPTEMRIKPPSGSTESRPRQACPNTLDMCRKFWALAGHFLNNATIPTRDREILVLRTAWLSRGEYEWGSHHDSYARKAGLTVEEVSRITQGPEAKGWSDFDVALLRAADQLHSSRFITDATWKSLAQRYNESQLVEVVLTVGNYTLLAMYFNALGVQLEPGKTGLPD